MLAIVAGRRRLPVDCGTRNFLYAALDATACAAFIKESRMKAAGAASRTGNPETRNFLYAVLDTTACAAFVKKSGMKPAGAASRTGNPEKGRSAMRLSVIVPARDEADVLQPCLESLLAQSEEGFAV